MHESAAKSPEVVARFKREAKAAAQLRSPHVVQILDHGVWRGVPYIAMELLEGEDLHRRLRRVRALSPREVVSIASQVGRALTKAHAAGLVHRDLKPANIFLTRDDEREIAKVLDFGVAKATAGSPLAEANTSTGMVLGTPFYMSPEHLRAEKSVDHRTDLWALSVVVYQCLVGKLPFRGDALAELVVKIMVDPIPVPSQAAPERGLPYSFDAWWARAVDRDVSKRFQTAKDLTEALSLALDVSLSTGPASMTGLSAVLPSPSAPAPAAPPVEELDSGLLHTAMPTVTPSPFTMGDASKPPPQALGSVPIQPTLSPGRRKPPVPLIVGAVGFALVAVVALVAFRGGEPAMPGAGDASAVAPAPRAPTAVAAPAPPAPTAVAAPAPTPGDIPSATPAASASAAPSAKASHPATPPPPPVRPASPPAPPPAAKARPKHEGVTDF